MMASLSNKLYERLCIFYEFILNSFKRWLNLLKKKQGRDVSHYGLAIYIENYLKAKKNNLWKLKYFTIAKI
jgi:hypothetical protein